jgi:hypothetical protein
MPLLSILKSVQRLLTAGDHDRKDELRLMGWTNARSGLIITGFVVV